MKTMIQAGRFEQDGPRCRSSGAAYLQRMAAVLESERWVREAEVDAAAAAPLSARWNRRVAGWILGRMIGRFAGKLSSIKKKEKKMRRPEQPVDVAGRKQQAA